MRIYSVYIMTGTAGTLYIGVTGNLTQRVYQHKCKTKQGFTSKYKISRLVYYEQMNDIRDAIHREKEIKKWRREKKNELIAPKNPEWTDLSEGWFPDLSDEES